MELAIEPEPGPEERDVLAIALERLLEGDVLPAAYRSCWRRAGIYENLEPEAEPVG